ncbi:PEP-CTERM sorting domain-containing protein [Crocosphaera sp.]|nr:PEP-CTERM sorting domain-containing protein [Crocosphaera sp.]MDJ0578587.1 PEP-CTERM sorting domain-containing protein [Crocosphaera sp.]
MLFEEFQPIESTPEPTSILGLLLMGGVSLLAKRQKSIK